MAALDEDAQISTVGEGISVQLVANAADTYYRGAVVFIDTGGGAQVTAAAADAVAGICPRQQTVAAGDLVEVIVHGAVWIPTPSGVASAAEENLALMMPIGAATDNPADADSSAIGAGLQANDMLIGRILRYTTANCLVLLQPTKLWSATLGWV